MLHAFPGVGCPSETPHLLHVRISHRDSTSTLKLSRKPQPPGMPERNLGVPVEERAQRGVGVLSKFVFSEFFFFSYVARSNQIRPECPHTATRHLDRCSPEPCSQAVS
eukprot:TRINITY_DN4208_c0_g2_i1.p1 TRINITY_DN4208_c0_g2~~TRINITY_DN4208_c0_g2_i1.p1  ORF type:complete len:108 (+),score=0.72 TRINITY_DN4208_c0_g2_i1:183-506(+)